jgi:RNA polymerase sigma-70 factor, ECF subfamily
MRAAAPVEGSPSPSPEAFAAFYDATFDAVYRYLSRAVFGNRVLAEDLTQETFASVVSAVRNGSPGTQTLPWVIGVARHKLIDHYRSSEREQRRMSLAWSSGIGHDDAQLDELASVDTADVVTLMQRLTPAHRLVLVLRYLDELSVEEVASEIGRSVHATESLLARARQALTRSYREMSP